MAPDPDPEPDPVPESSPDVSDGMVLKFGQDGGGQTTFFGFGHSRGGGHLTGGGHVGTTTVFFVVLTTGDADDKGACLAEGGRGFWADFKPGASFKNLLVSENTCTT